MSIPTARLPVALEGSNRRPAGLLAPFVSALCFIHCIGMAAVLPWIPAAAAFIDLPGLEWALLLLSLGATAWVLRRTRAGLAAAALGVAFAAVIVFGLSTEREYAQQLGFLGLVALQITLVLRHRRASAHGCAHPHPAATTAAPPSRPLRS